VSQINEATGLPELPEGQWWEVRKSPAPNPSDYLYVPSAGIPWFEVVIRETRTFQELPEPGRWPWSRDIPGKSVSKVVDIASQDLWDHKLKRYARDLTPRLIRKAAFSLIQSQNREARMLSLLGAYPPKKLDAK
jgi:hypothetical protein